MQWRTRFVALAFLFFSLPTFAMPVTFFLSGKFPGETPSDDFSGKSFWSYITVDDEPLSSTTNHATYVSNGNPYGIVFGIGDQIGVGDHVSVEVGNDFDFFPVNRQIDYVFLTASTLPGTGVPHEHSMYLRFWLASFDLSAIDTTDLFPNPGRFSQYCFEIMFCSLEIGDQFAGGGFIDVENFTIIQAPFAIPVPTHVPEPSLPAMLTTCSLLVLALASTSKTASDRVMLRL